MNDYPKAKESYKQALELTFGITTHASPRSNAVIRKVCMEENVGLADLELAFERIAPYGLLGREQFYDHCHWYEAYHLLVAEVIIRELAQNSKTYSQGIRFDLHPFPSLHDFPTLSKLGKDVERVYRQSQSAIFEATIVYPKSYVSEPAISYFETLYLMNPDTLWDLQFKKDEIKENFLNEFSIKEFMSIFNFEKHWPSILYHIGETYRRLRRYKEALQYFNKATSLDENYSLPYIGRALTYYALGNKEKVLANINNAERNSKNLAVKHYKEILGL